MVRWLSTCWRQLLHRRTGARDVARSELHLHVRLFILHCRLLAQHDAASTSGRSAPYCSNSSLASLPSLARHPTRHGTTCDNGVSTFVDLITIDRKIASSTCLTRAGLPSLRASPFCPYPGARMTAYSLLEDKARRLSSLNDVKAHPFFRGVQWETLRDGPAPFVPALDSETE